ncbi:hypothetical protein ACFWHT_00080 [Microbacterium sp. NPDC058342]|uniref:hypothetical protein n=1 Tax=Microbacterium sp. NPDC058342 TaxID=3346454 RepID=UPI00364A5963
MAEEWQWLESGPVFSAPGRRGGRVVRVPQRATLAPVGADWILTVAAFALSGAVLVVAAGLLIDSAFVAARPAGWWWLALAVPALLATVFFFSGTYVVSTERAMKPASVGLIVAAGLAGAAALGTGVLALVANVLAAGREHDDRAAEGLTIAAALAGVALVVLAFVSIRSVREARGEVHRILRLRASASRHPGMIMALPDPDAWNGGGDVPIRYTDDAGDHVITMRLTAYAHEIPVRGSRVLVLRGAGGDVHVELDPEHPVTYTPHSARYESDSSGGGS